MATGRTEFELKTFLEGSKDQYDAFIKANGAEGVLFFDTNNHAVYAKDKCVIKSNVASVELVVPTGSTGTDKTAIKLTYFDGSSDEIDTAIPNAFVRFDETQNLTDPQKQTARTNIGAEAADATILKQGNVVNNLTTDSATVPLSAAQGKALKGLIDKNTTKLAGIDEGAQTNRQITVNGAIVGTDANETNITITGNLIRGTNPEGGEFAINLYGEYDSDKKKIVFKTDDTEDALDLFDIDATDFIKDSFVKGGSYDADKKALILTLVTGKNDDGSDKTEPVEIPVGGLIDEYTAGNGLSLSGTTFSAKLGNGLQIDTYKSITLKPTTNGGITVNAAGVAVDWTKAPIQKVNNVTPDANGNVSIDVTPKVWSF